MQSLLRAAIPEDASRRSLTRLGRRAGGGGALALNARDGRAHEAMRRGYAPVPVSRDCEQSGVNFGHEAPRRTEIFSEAMRSSCSIFAALSWVNRTVGVEMLTVAAMVF